MGALRAGVAKRNEQNGFRPATGAIGTIAPGAISTIAPGAIGTIAPPAGAIGTIAPAAGNGTRGPANTAAGAADWTSTAMSSNQLTSEPESDMEGAKLARAKIGWNQNGYG